jgi:hypothetical protein
MNSKLLLPLIFVSAAIITPACANWFSNPSLGINRNVGSAPSPTPDQVRQEKEPPFVLRDPGAAGTVADAGAAKQAAPTEAKPAQTIATAAPKR